MADIILKDKDGLPVTESNITEVELDTTGGGTAIFSEGQVTSGTVASSELTFASQNYYEVTPSSGYLFNKVTINKPNGLEAGNIKDGTTIAGVLGTFSDQKPEDALSIGANDLDFTTNPVSQSFSPTSGHVYSGVTVVRPANLEQQNIAKNITIAGITGTFEGGKPEETKNVTLDFSNDAQTQSVPATTGYVMTEVIIQRPSTLIPNNIRSGYIIAGVPGSLEVSFLDELSWLDGQTMTDLYIDIDTYNILCDRIQEDILLSDLSSLSYSDGTMTFGGQSIGYSDIGLSYLRALDFSDYETNAYAIAWCRDSSNIVFLYSGAAFENSTLGIKFSSSGWQRRYVNLRDNNGDGVTFQKSQFWDVLYSYRNVVLGVGAIIFAGIPVISPFPRFSKYNRPSYLINPGDTLTNLYFNTQYNPTPIFTKLLYNYTTTWTIGGSSVIINYCPLAFGHLIAVDLSSINVSLAGEYGIFWDETLIYTTSAISELSIADAGWQISSLNVSSDNIVADYSKMHSEFLKILDEFSSKNMATFGVSSSSGGATVEGNVLRFSDSSYVSGNVLHIASNASVVGNTLVLSGGGSATEEQIFAELNAQLWGSNS